MKFIPKPLQKWLTDHIIKGRIMTQVARLIKLPVTAVKFFPYKYGEDSYFIPLTPDSADERGDDGLPVPPLPIRQGYGKTADEYIASGKEHVHTMLEMLRKANYSLRGKRVLDLGCGGGRMIRHLREYADSGEIWGADVSAEYILWCKQYLGPLFKFATTTTLPHLPFEDRYFDFVYTGSVFTHIDDLHDSWLLEIRRVLSPGGMFYVTVHDEHTIELLDTVYKNGWFEKYLNDDPVYRAQKEKAGMIVVGRSTDSQVFYNLDFFKKNINSIFEVILITHEAYGYQTGILLEKKDKAQASHVNH